MKWRNVGTVVFDDGEVYETLYACPRCKALVCGGETDEHEAWHKQQHSELFNRTDPRLYG